MHIKKGDLVKIIAGKEKKSPPARVLRVLVKENRVVVEGRNLVKKHVKGNPMRGTESGILEKEAAVHVSNVALWSETLNKPVRAQNRYLGANDAPYASRAEARRSFGDNAPAVIEKVRFVPASGEIIRTGKNPKNAD